MAQPVDVLEQLPAGGNVSKPSSGTYGETAALDRLKAELPGGDPTQSRAIAPAPMPPGPAMGPGGGATPGDLPPGILAPTRRPGEPTMSPLSPGPPPMATADPERRIQLLHAIAADQSLSPVTREFAQRFLDSLIRA